ncbi:hypothetical protein KUL10_16160 [Glaciecola sp. KUL10]|nr:hypothetical protein KUL10_16160 [Glaciecola sp. KUL10]
MNKTIFKKARKLHKWLGLILGIQVFFWIAGGLIMSAIPLEKVHGKHLANKVINNNIGASEYRYSLDKLIGQIDEQIIEIKFSSVLELPVYIIQTHSNRQLFNAQTGDVLDAISQTQIRALAKQHYLGQGKLEKISLLNDIPMEASRAKNSVWQLIYDDTWSTTLYFDPVSAELVSIRSDIWRLFDFVWMLHIMDYDEREDFNNPLLIAFSASALLFTLSGMLMLFQTFRLKKLGIAA